MSRSIFYRGLSQAQIDQNIVSAVAAINPSHPLFDNTDSYMREAIASIPANTNNEAAMGILAQRLSQAEATNWRPDQADGIKSAMVYYNIRKQIAASPNGGTFTVDSFDAQLTQAKGFARTANAQSNPEFAAAEANIPDGWLTSSSNLRQAGLNLLAAERKRNPGITNEELLSNLTNESEDTDQAWYNPFRSVSKEVKHTIIGAAVAILSGTPVSAPSGNLLISDAQAATLPAKPAGAGKLDIRNGEPYALAWGEFMGAGGSNVPEAIRRRADALVRSVPNAVTNEAAFNEAFRKFDAASAGDTDEARANAWARGLVYRARHIQHCREQHQTSISSFANGQEMQNYYFGNAANNGINTKRQQLAGAGAVSGGAGAGGAGGSAADDSNDAGPAKLWRSKDGTAAPAATEIPKLAQNQVSELQSAMVAAGLDIGASGADHKYGPKTHKALKDFAHSLGIDDLTKVDFMTVDAEGHATDPNARKILDALSARVQARGQTAGGPAAAPAAAAPAAPAIANSDQAAAAMVTTASANENDNNYGSMTPDSLKTMLGLVGITLTPEQLSRVTIQNGIIHSPDIARLEQALNAVKGDAPALTVDGNWDARLTQIARAEGVKTFIGAVFSGNVQTASAPGSTPGGAAPGNGGRAPA